MKVYQGLSELQLKIQLFQDIIKKVIFIKRREKMAEYKLLKTEGVPNVRSFIQCMVRSRLLFL